MSDTTPPLPTDGSISFADDNYQKKKQVTKNFPNWYRYLKGCRTHDNDQTLDDDSKSVKKDPSINFFQLFRFADRIDFLIICGGLFVILLQCLSYCVNLVIFAKLSGSIAVLSFSQVCSNQQSNLSNTTASNNDCPLGLNLNVSNSDRPHKLCYHYINTTSIPSTSVINPTMIGQVHWMLLATIIQLFAGFLQQFAFSVTAKRQTSRMRVCLFRSIIQRNIHYFDLDTTGQLSNKLFSHIDTIHQGIGFNFAVMLEVYLGTLICTIICFVINWKLTLVMLCFLPLILGGSYIFTKLTARETMTELRTYSRAGAIAQEVFSSLRTVLSLNGVEFEKKRYEKELIATRWSSVRKGVIYGLYLGWSFLNINLLYSVGFIVGLLLMHNVEHDKTSLSDILVVVTVFAEAISYMGSTGPFLQSLSEAQGAAVDVFRIIDQTFDKNMNEEQIWDENNSDKETTIFNGDIMFDNVNFEYPTRKDVPVLCGLSLVARAGETTALVGASGCGKCNTKADYFAEIRL